MKRILKSLGVVLVIFIIALVIGAMDDSGLTHEDLIEIANELNDECPLMVDEITRLDSCKAISAKDVEYNYTIIDYSKDDFETEGELDDIKSTMKVSLIDQIKTDSDMEFIRYYNLNLTYNYNDMNNEEWFSIVISPEDYK